MASPARARGKDQALAGAARRRLAAVSLAASLLAGAVAPDASAATWSLTQNGSVLEIAYGSGAVFPQVAALHTESGYFRMRYLPDAGWGTSVVLVPALWSGGAYHQGAAVAPTARLEDADLVLVLAGTIAGLGVSTEVRLSPPAGGTLTARVITTVSGDATLDDRPGEAFKPVVLSSMRVSPTLWDAQAAYVGCDAFALPSSGWIVQPPRSGERFALRGGASDWKQNAPSVDVRLDRPLAVTGWVTPSGDPNDDNVGFWAASAQVLPAWSYTLRAAPLPHACGLHLPTTAR
jgi:hypothetical protein